jgi:non-heme chloroperoxidase
VVATRFANIRIATGPLLHYAEQGNAGGEAIVFLHGWPDSWFSFSRVAEWIPEGYRALLLDQRGFGESERPDGGYDIRSMAADVTAFLDALSIERATIVGHSFGSFVARRVALDDPERVSRLALIGTGWLGSNGVTREVYASLHDLSDPVSRDFARDFQASTAFAPLPEAFFEQIVSESLKLPSRLWAVLLGGVIDYDDVNELGEMAVPTLLLWGDRDALFSRDDQNRLVAAIPQAKLRIYPEIGHCPNWECPDEVAADLVAFTREEAVISRQSSVGGRQSGAHE